MDHSQIDQAALQHLLGAIEARYGFDLRQYSVSSISRRIAALSAKHGLSGLKAIEERVLDDPEFFAAFIDYMMVQVSEFFRDPHFFLAFRKRVISTLRTYPLLRIWHAGCATGEEVYSLAILLSEEGLYERVQIYATDLSAEAIARAKVGIYPARHLPKLTENHGKSGGTAPLEVYCRTSGEDIAIKDSLKKNIVFFQHDLVSDHVFGEMQVVFCRNVLIYFGPELKARVIDKLAGAICRGGFLCLGTSEGTPRPSEGRLVELAAQEHIYRRVK
jgi:chemotaxis protein methyltransferase CheR